MYTLMGPTPSIPSICRTQLPVPNLQKCNTLSITEVAGTATRQLKCALRISLFFSFFFCDASLNDYIVVSYHLIKIYIISTFSICCENQGNCFSERISTNRNRKGPRCSANQQRQWLFLRLFLHLGSNPNSLSSSRIRLTNQPDNSETMKIQKLRTSIMGNVHGIPVPSFPPKKLCDIHYH